MKASHKISAGVMTIAAVFGLLSPMVSPVPIHAKSTVKATSSGSTSGNESNTIRSSNCTGTQMVSGLDAEIFSKIKPDHAGTIVCSKSDGFKTTATGTNNVNSYHWTAWYKNSLEEDVDRTQGNGTYHGFSKDKVKEWQQYAENIKKLNGGRFPEYKDYIYPTDTADGKLSFWGDIAGYYGILGDPQYAKIHLEAFQQFSYRVEKTTKSESWYYDSNYCNDYPNECPPPADKNPGKDDGNKKPGNGGSDSGKNDGKDDDKGSGNKGDSGGGSSFCDKYPNKCVPPEPTSPQGPVVCSGGMQSWGCVTFCPGGGGGCSSNSSNQNPNLGDEYFPGLGGRSVDTKSTCSGKDCSLHNVRESSKTTYQGKGWYKTVTTKVYSYNERKLVKVADANVAAKAYATEIAAYDRIALKPGSKGTLQYNVDHDKFWKVTPGYWVDGGKETITNDSSYPYHFASEGSEGKGKNNINLYALISKKDKLYTVIHGYPDITEVPDLPDEGGFPNNPDETCVGKTCSKDETPLIEIPIDITKDEPQSQVEVDKFIHLTKDKK